mgnify:CR=1 FL=1
MKFYEIETKAFFFDKNVRINAKKEGFFEILTNVKRENPQSAYFL